MNRISQSLRELRLILDRDDENTVRDADLLGRFVRHNDEAAFAALVERHGPMVSGVCQRLLENSEDAADALQGTFLVLARRARKIQKPDSLAAWLYGVAYRVAKDMRNSRSTRQRRELEAQRPAATAPVDHAWRELQAALDEEMQALPEKHRQPLLLCFLEGLSQEEAARQLGWTRGTLKRRLERGRELLRRRLTRRGLTLGAAAVATLSASRALAAPVAPSAGTALARVAALFAVRKPLPADVVQPATTTLAEGVLKTMLVAKIKIVSAAFAVFVALSAAGAVLYAQTRERVNLEIASAQQENPAPKAPTDQSAPSAEKKTDQPPTVKDEFAKFLKEWDAAWSKFQREFKRAGNDLEKMTEVGKTNPSAPFLKRCIELAEKHAASEDAIDPALWVMNFTRPNPGENLYERALAVLAKHPDSHRLRVVIPALPNEDGTCAELLKAVLAKHPDQKTQARAARLLRVNVPDKLANLLPDMNVGAKLPDAAFVSLDGRKRKMSDFRGKVLLVHVFSMERHQPEWIFRVWQDFWREDFAGRPVVQVLICVDDDKERFQKWSVARPMNSINVWAGRDSEFFLDWMGDGERRGAMSTFLVDPDGAIRMNMRDTLILQELERAMEDLLIAAKAPFKEPPPVKIDGKGLTEAAHAFEQLRSDYERAARKNARAYRFAADDAAKRAAAAEFDWLSYSRKALELAEKHIDDPASLDLLVFAARNGPREPMEDWVHAVFLLSKHHAKNPRLIEFLRPMTYAEFTTIDFLRKVTGENPDEKNRARACKLVKEHYDIQSAGAEQYLQANEDLKRAIVRRTGAKYVQQLLDDFKQNKELRAKFIKLYDDKYAKVLPTIRLGQQMPDVTLTDLEGKKFKLSDLRGKIVYLNIFSAEFHRPEMAKLREFAERMKGKPFVGVNISIDERKETFTKWLEREPSPWRSVWCGRHSDLCADWMMQSYQTTYLVDAKGVLRTFAAWADLPDDVEKLLEGMEK